MKKEKTIDFWELDNGKRYAVKKENGKAILTVLPSKVNGKLLVPNGKKNGDVLATVNLDKMREFIKYMKVEEDTGVTVEEQLKEVRARFK